MIQLFHIYYIDREYSLSIVGRFLRDYIMKEGYKWKKFFILSEK